MNPLDTIKKSFLTNLAAYLEADMSKITINLDAPPNPEMGDIAIACFPFAKMLKKSPVEIAKSIAENISIDLVAEIIPTGPYLNLKLDASAFIKTTLSEVAEVKAKYGRKVLCDAKKFVIEYSAPNTNKPQHIGHIRNNILGKIVANILLYAGHDVVKVNLVNDRGIHICKSMLAYKKWGEGKTPESENIKGDHFVGDYYVLFEKEYQKDESLIKEAQEMLLKWEEGDVEVRNLWSTMNGWVMDGFAVTYDRLGCSFDKYYMESETYKLGKEIVLEGLKDGLLRKNDRGDIVVDLEGFEVDEKVLLRADGSSIYITQDLGTTALKFSDFNPDQAVWVVASEQNLYFRMLFYVLKKLGYEWAEKCYHLSYGMVYLPEGKMKSREGKVIDADDLMDELKAMAKGEIVKRDREMTGDELEMVTEAVGISALTYFILKIHPSKDIHFQPEESLAFEGTTGPYAQYSYARLSSIIRKGGEMLDGEIDYSLLGNSEEKRLAFVIASFPDVVQEAANTFNPARIATYIYDLSRAINKFHHDHLVIDEEDIPFTVARGGLIKAARQVLGNALRLAGIEPLDRM